jgi:hypothetical protein
LERLCPRIGDGVMAVRDVVQAAAGVGGGDNLYVEDVFSTYLYTGNGSTQTITNGIDLAGEGGLVWVKIRSFGNHALTDTVRGGDKTLSTSGTFAESSPTVMSFNSDGWNWVSGNFVNTNATDQSYASWTFRKAPKFFSVVTWTGDGASSQNISHSLGSSVGSLIVKSVGSTGNWFVWHKDIGTDYLVLNSTGSRAGGIIWNYTAPTSTVFTVGDDLNINGATYVAYLFAHDAGGFGDDGTENVISCGSYTGNSSTTGPVIDLGYEPQWVLIKGATITNSWYLHDNMRGMTYESNTASWLVPNTSAAEVNVTSTDAVMPTATGFQIGAGGANWNESGNTYIYIAIRRGPMKTPESGTEVFEPFETTNSTSAQVIGSLSQPDMFLSKRTDGDQTWRLIDRLRSGSMLRTDDADTETGASNFLKWDVQSGVQVTVEGAPSLTNDLQAHWLFRRAPSVFDVVATPQTAAGAGTVTHNLGVAPEFIILKGRDYTESWRCYHAALGRGAVVQLNLPDAPYAIPNYWGTADPTATEFGVSWNSFTAPNYIAYLFASCPGVSKVSSYTGTGADLNVDCGFSAGARFILIKRTDPGSTGDWYVWDSARGIVSGNDPYLLLNTTGIEVTNTDYIDPLASGFTVTSSAPAALNASGGTYIFLAIA